MAGAVVDLMEEQECGMGWTGCGCGGRAEPDRKRLMGQSLKGDVMSGVYGHRGVEELRECVEKI